MESEREQLRKLLKSQSLMFGDFTLASGKKSSFYFDSEVDDPAARRRVADRARDPRV